ncbi:MAG TPA: VanW family protein [Candidatus Limnocylindria bacterium]|jgi:vancomycin resistance protein YoaR|nr:VanW family protein [Candidatus Limnocylindria bacterium]
MTSPSAATRIRFVPSGIRTRGGFLIGFAATLLLGLLLLLGASIGVALGQANHVMPGVSVGGVQLGGLDREAAAARLAAELPSLDQGSISLSVDRQTTSVSLSQFHRHYDIDATLDMAFGVARSGNPFSDSLDRLRALAGPTFAGEAVLLQDPRSLDAIVASIGKQFDRDPLDARVRSAGPGVYVPVPAAAGLQVQRDALRTALEEALDTTAPPPSVTVLVTRSDPAISSAEAEAAASAASAVTARAMTLKGAGQKLKLSPADLGALITFGQTATSWGMTLDEDAIRDLLQPTARRIAREPRNASFAWGSNGAVGFYPGQSGRKLKLNASVARVVAALGRRAAGSSVPTATLAVGVVQPSVTNAEARKVAPEMRRLGTWTTYFVPGEGNFWGANITIPARDIDGRVIAPGEWFEFWQGIGPVTLAHGYGYGGAIIGGRSVANGALAGGICSTSTTLFNAAMRAGLEIGQRTNHSYYIDRYPVGLDATVFKTDSYETDMTFRNDTANPIVIRSYWGSGFVRFDIWGVPDGRTVTLSKPITSNHGTAVWTTVTNPALKPGTSVIREYPHDGFDAVVTRWVRDADGNLIHTDTWTSHYRTVNGVTEYGPRRS